MSRCNIAIYMRLSKFDNDKGRDVSNSITNQKRIIDNYIVKHFRNANCSYYVDDGYSGMNYDRPEFKKMLMIALEGTIDIIIVKDLSRLGREYIETGKYIHKIFPSLAIRFIAINDDYDSNNASISKKHLIIPIKSFINECYSRDISAKVRSNMRVMRQEGKYVGAYVCYGYKKDESNHNKIVIDREVEYVIRYIFKMYLCGCSIGEIKSLLNSKKVDSPYEHKLNYNDRYHSGFVTSNKKCMWSYASIRRILENEIYMGDLVQGKRTTVNYKIKKNTYNDRKDWVRVRSNHEAIVSKEEYYATKLKLAIDNKVSKKLYILSGRLRCYKCGNIMVRRTNKQNTLYICSEYNRCGNCVRNEVNEKVIEKILVIVIKKMISIKCYKNLQNKLENNLKYIMKDELNSETQREEIKSRCYIYWMNLYISKVIVCVSLDKHIRLNIEIIETYK